jgi:hypothetical protein
MSFLIHLSLQLLTKVQTFVEKITKFRKQIDQISLKLQKFDAQINQNINY